jgi:CHAD domain-containing protein
LTKILEVLQEHAVAVTPESNIAEGGREAMRRYFVQLLEHEVGSKLGNDIEDIHQMRVATRRIRTLFSLLAPYYKRRAVSEYRRDLKKLARRLGKVRDLDVQIADLQKYIREQDSNSERYNEILHFLLERRTKAHQQLVAFLEDKQYRQLRRKFARFLQDTGKGASKFDQTTPSQIRHVLPVLIHQHLAAVRAFDAVIDSEDPPFHELRIECKRLRYILEAFAEMLGASANPFLAELKRLQDELGAMQDIDVTVAFLADIFNKTPLDSEKDLAVQDYIAYRKQKAGEHQETFRKLWKKFNGRTVQQQLSDALLVLR